MQTIKITLRGTGEHFGPVLKATTPGGELRASMQLCSNEDYRRQAQEFAALCAAKWWGLSLSGFGDLNEDSWVATLEGSLYQYDDAEQVEGAAR